ncbi:hypothetical protein ABID29_001810 [Streptococcus rupicaprae]|uniref:Uncharacterized protein n=1 Tax=Streptococcus rupicaprae TaxID=759619 RepID=A0ABV2FJE7_9STRE
MSLNKTRKQAIARARRRLEMPGQELISGYTVEQLAEVIQAMGRIVQAIIDGMVAFGKAFSESIERQLNEQAY